MTDPTAEPDAPDPLALRALAHPIRWKLIDVLTTEGTVTATRCAELIGESTATCSYHLGVLAKYGYITRVAGAQWRLVNPDLNLSSSGLDDEQAAASRAAAAAFVDFEMTRLKDSLHRSAPEGWQDAHKIMATTAWLDAAELSQAIAEMRRVLDTYADRGRVPAERRKGARPARLFAAVTLMPSAGPDD
jgi:hypothetical protein